jgi:hypothetical protein
MIGVPLSVVFGWPLPGWLLGCDGHMGLQGWQGMYLIEGLPAVLLGVVVVVENLTTPAPWQPTEVTEAKPAVIAAAEQKELFGLPGGYRRWMILGGGGAAVVAGLGAGVTTLLAQPEIDELRGHLSPAGELAAGDADGLALRDSLQTKGMMTGVFLGVAVAGAGAACACGGRCIARASGMGAAGRAIACAWAGAAGATRGGSKRAALRSSGCDGTVAAGGVGRWIILRSASTGGGDGCCVGNARRSNPRPLPRKRSSGNASRLVCGAVLAAGVACGVTAGAD